MTKNQERKAGEKEVVEAVAQGIMEMASHVNRLINEGAGIIVTTVKLSREVWKAAKLKAINEGLKLSQVVEAALRKYLELEE
jgi:3-oxoacyl-ACP reductase-like protein